MNNYKYNKRQISFYIKELVKDLIFISIRLIHLILKGKVNPILISFLVIVLRRKDKLKKITIVSSPFCLPKLLSIKVNRKSKE